MGKDNPALDMVEAVCDKQAGGAKCPRMHLPARRCPLRMPPGHTPHLPVLQQSFPEQIQEFFALVIGCQSKDIGAVAKWRVMMAETMAKASAKPFEQAHSHFVDRQGYENEFHIVYFTNAGDVEEWERSTEYMVFFQSSEREADDAGYWIERFRIPMDHVEAMFTPDAVFNPSKYQTGVGRLGDSFYPSNFCNYGGSMRDRIPYSGQSELHGLVAELPENSPDETLGKRVSVQLPPHVAVIRSGQDWSSSEGEPREFFTRQMLPVLKAGMDHLAREQVAAGTISNRFVRDLDDAGNELESSYGLCYSISLAHLEAWADPKAGHPTHMAIYKKFYEGFKDEDAVAKGLPAGLMTGTSLFHEVFVTPDAEGCTAEYVNCHNKTAFLQWASGPKKLW